jgi:glucose/arabinose dehydrogenase/mono/diheme cytochrome c family protein
LFKKIFKASVYIFMQLLILVLALLLGEAWSSEYNVIPRFLFRLPATPLTDEVFLQTLYTLITIGLIFYTISTVVFSSVNFKNYKRTMKELYTTLTSFTFSMLYIFFATDLLFSPNFFAASGILYFFLLLITQQIFDLVYGTLNSISTLINNLKLQFTQLFKVSFSVGGIIILLFACSPLLLMKAYTSNRDVANFVTKIRLALTQEKYENWVLVNSVPDITFVQPIMAQFDPNNDDFVYVLERHGRLYKINYKDKNDKILVLDFSKMVGEVDMENGALGFDLHPDFGQSSSENKGYVYIYYTDFSAVTGDQQTNRLSRFDLTSNDIEERNSSEYPLIEFFRPSDGYHNGGSVEFGPDSFLYIAIGESSEPSVHQTIDRKLHGGIFRIDVNKVGGEISHEPPRQAQETISQGYYIPNDNPFVGQSNALEEFWALGLRNPFRISFDPETDKLWLGDVGSTRFEEINVIEKGGNYQFPFIEGFTPTDFEKPATLIGTEIKPKFYYEHTAYERSIIGGVVYRPNKYPELSNNYIYMDNYSGRIYAIDADRDILENPVTLTRSEQVAQRGITSIITSPTGEILATSLGHSQIPTGRLLKLVPATAEFLDIKQQELKKDEEQTIQEASMQIDIAKVYNVNCARCHGVSGVGDGPDSELLEAEIPDFTSSEFQTSRTNEELDLVIRMGGEAGGLSFEMPPWEGFLTENELVEIIDYLRTFQDKKDPSQN